jgi:hypothetical protein
MIFKLLLIGLGLVLFVGVVRRWFFAGAWRIIVPLIVAGIIAVPLAAKINSYGAPAWMNIVGPIFAGLIIAYGLRYAIDEFFGPPKG